MKGKNGGDGGGGKKDCVVGGDADEDEGDYDDNFLLSGPHVRITSSFSPILQLSLAEC